MSNSRLLIRVEAGAHVGTGHFMRTLALAQAWHRAGSTVTFAMTALPAALRLRLDAIDADIALIDAPAGAASDAGATAALARDATHVVIDGYMFPAAFQQTVKDTGARLLVIDDDGRAGCYVADLVLNQNRHASAALYARRDAGTRLLLGSAYVLLRDEYVRRGGTLRHFSADCVRVLVTFGGSDPNNNTARALRALARVDRAAVRVTALLGAANPHTSEIAELAQETGAAVMRDSSDMAQLLAHTDLVVGSGGSTVWELLFMRTPAVLGASAPVEALLLDAVADEPDIRQIGWYRDVSLDDLAAAIDERLALHRPGAQAECGAGSIDGLGADRVVSALRSEQVNA